MNQFFTMLLNDFPLRNEDIDWAWQRWSAEAEVNSLVNRFRSESEVTTVDLATLLNIQASFNEIRIWILDNYGVLPIERGMSTRYDVKFNVIINNRHLIDCVHSRADSIGAHIYLHYLFPTDVSLYEPESSRSMKKETGEVSQSLARLLEESSALAKQLLSPVSSQHPLAATSGRARRLLEIPGEEGYSNVHVKLIAGRRLDWLQKNEDLRKALIEQWLQLMPQTQWLQNASVDIISYDRLVNLP